MKDDRIYNSINQIEPRKGAKERMYNNIQSKAKNSRDNSTKSSTARLYRTLVPIAACLCIAMLGIFHFIPSLPSVSNPPTDSYPNEFLGSPYQDCASSADFEQFGVSLCAPEGTENVRYSILDGDIACVDFTFDGRSYFAMASKQTGDFTGINGDIIQTEQIDAQNSAILETVHCLEDIYYRVSWTDGETHYFLCNSDSTEKHNVIDLYKLMTVDK